MADVRIRFIGEDKASQELEKVDKSIGGIASSLSTLDKATAAIAAIGVTLNKAFDLGRAGAEVMQTAESFDLLLEKVGAAPDLLGQLQSASKGTISDMELMSSTSTLLAGAQGDLASALANSTPKLLEIAKAAQKLNPSLGDTTFLYESLATGIKRASPLILDNLGLTIRIGDANQQYAESLGKTVEQLTAEEQKMALLNATLDAGGVLIDQVGGSTDSATDAFDRMDAAIANAADAIKVELAPTITDAANTITLLITQVQALRAALSEHSDEVYQTAENYDDYRTELERAAAAAGMVIDAEGNLIQIQNTALGQRRALIQENYLLSETEFEMARNAEDADRAMLGYAKALETLNMETVKALGPQVEMKDVIKGLEEALRATGMESDDVARAVNDIKVQFGELSQAEADAIENTRLLNESYAAGIITQDEYIASTQQLMAGTLELTDAEREAMQAELDRLEVLKESAEAQEELALRQFDLALQLSESYTSIIETYEDGVDRIKDKQDEIAEKIEEYRQKIRESRGDADAVREYREEIEKLKEAYNDTTAELTELNAELESNIENMVAQAALNELERARSEGQITTEQYLTAATGVAEAFGLLDETGTAVALAVTEFTAAVADGTLPAEEFDEVMVALAEDAKDGEINLQALRDQFLGIPDDVDPGTEAIDEFGKKATAAAEDAGIAAGDIEQAFSGVDWHELGMDVGQGIADGIRDSIDEISDAAAEAAEAAEDSAREELDSQSPSKKAYSIGQDFAGGFAMGVTDSTSSLSDTVAGSMSDFAESTAGSVGAGGGTPIQLVINIGGEQLTSIVLDAAKRELNI